MPVGRNHRASDQLHSGFSEPLLLCRAATVLSVSLHIEDVERVEGVLIDGQWIDVDPGTFERHIPSTRGSAAPSVVYRWTFDSREYLTGTGDLMAVRLIQAEPPTSQ